VTHVLVVDDDPQILRAIDINLRARGYDVKCARDGREALVMASRRPPDLVILDLGLPDMDGTDVIRGLRGWTTAPIMILSGRGDSRDKVEALDAGADDYITKPFDIEELLARVRAVGRRGDRLPPATVLSFGALDVDFAARTVTGAGGEEVRLTPTEWHILEVLTRHPGRLVTQREVLTEVWGPQYVKETSYLRVYLTGLRRKLEPDPGRPRYLITEPGMGYCYEP
jgi:two-component system KDP operon response regulator KdpE